MLMYSYNPAAGDWSSRLPCMDSRLYVCYMRLDFTRWCGFFLQMEK